MPRVAKIALKIMGPLLVVYLLACAGAYRAFRTVEGTTKLMSAADTLMFVAFPLERLMTSARAGDLEVGQPAPDFELEFRESPEPNGDPEQDSETERVRLSSFQGKKPVVLVFGSYT